MERLARLLNDRNSIEREIGEIIGRPALTGHIGEYIAAEIFNINDINGFLIGTSSLCPSTFYNIYKQI